MIYTITLNPAVDLVLSLDDLELGALNRSQSEDYVAGGKGINMSVLLNRLGYETIASGFLGGFTGHFIQEELAKEGVETAFIPVSGTTRINLKLKGQEETEVNAAGAPVTNQDFQALLDYLSQHLTNQDTVFLAGNAAPGLGADHYAQIADLVHRHSARFVIDSNNDLLTATLMYHPFVIKPNLHELEEIFGRELKSQAEIIECAQELQERGAHHVLVSLGGDGALLVTAQKQVFRANVPQGQLINSVGAGDSMIAGFTAKYLETQDPAQSLAYGSACGSATAFSMGIASQDLVEELVPKIKVEEIEE